MLKNRSRTIAINAVFLGLVIASTFMTLIPVAGVGSAIFPLIVLVVGSQIEGKYSSLFLGFAFGLASFIISFINPSPLAPVFRNPLVSILPRILIAFLGLMVYIGLEKLSKLINARRIKKNKQAINPKLTKLIASTFGSAFTVFFNTLFVLSMIYAIYHGQNIGGTAITVEFIMTLISINFVIEIVGTTIVAPPIVLVVGKYVANLKRTVVISNDDDDDYVFIDDIDNQLYSSENNNNSDIEIDSHIDMDKSLGDNESSEYKINQLTDGNDTEINDDTSNNV